MLPPPIFFSNFQLLCLESVYFLVLDRDILPPAFAEVRPIHFVFGAVLYFRGYI